MKNPGQGLPQHAEQPPALSRRGFLRIANAAFAAAVLPGIHLPQPEGVGDWPEMRLEDLPLETGAILARAPRVVVDTGGYLQLNGARGQPSGQVPLRRTKWNQEVFSASARLRSDVPWGIVLHWYGDQEGFDKTVSGYLRGFDSLRPVDYEEFDLEGYLAAMYGVKKKPGERSKPSLKLHQDDLEQIYAHQDPYDPVLYRTSAHFLVGEALALPEGSARDTAIGIVQTQAPYADGTPLVANHVMAADYEAYQQGKQYYALALNHLSRLNPQNHSLLQEIYTGPRVYPNQRLIGIEMCGYQFDHPDHLPVEQQIANVVAVVWALMERYRIPATSILGHNELNQGKGDPGKKFLALVRYLIGAKALIEKDERMQRLVFGQFMNEGSDPREAILSYFSLIWNYQALINTQKQVYEWEALSKYWFLVDQVAGRQAGLRLAKAYCRPMGESSSWSPQKAFLSPEDHEGVDLYVRPAQRQSASSSSGAVRLLADGVCVFSGETHHCARGKTLMFRHRQVDGAEVISVYSHLSQTGGIQVGESRQVGEQIGVLDGQHDGFLHFALAYGATWATDLSQRPDLPLNAKQSWILQRYLQPLQYLQERV